MDKNLWYQCETWVFDLKMDMYNIYIYIYHKGLTKRLLSPQRQEKSDNCWARKPRARLYMHLSQARSTTATVWKMDYQIISSRNSSVCKTQLPDLFSVCYEEIWSHKSCTRYASLAFSCQIPDWIQNAVDHLQRISWQGTWLHPGNDDSNKNQTIFHKIQWCLCLEGSKFQAWYFRQACIHSVWASGMELLTKGN